MSVPVFYSSQMVANSGCYSPSANKPEQVIQSWQLLGIPLQVSGVDVALITHNENG